MIRVPFCQPLPGPSAHSALVRLHWRSLAVTLAGIASLWSIAIPTRSETIETVAGAGLLNFRNSEGGSNLARPYGINGDDGVYTYITDPANHTLYRFDPWSIAQLLAGDGVPGFRGDGGDSTLSRLNNPHGVAVDSNYTVYIADTGNHRIRRFIKDSGVIDTFAGSDKTTFSGIGGPATEAGFTEPMAVAVDSKDRVYIADAGANRILRVEEDGSLQLFAGGGSVTNDPDGTSATDIALDRPVALVFDGDGMLYVAEERGRRLRRISPDGIVETLADENGKTGVALKGPRGVQFNPDTGEVYVSDGNQILRYSEGKIDIYAGTGEPGFKGEDAPVESSQLYRPANLAWDLYLHHLEIADEENGLIRTVDFDSIYSFNRRGMGLDSDPLDARIVWPESISFDNQGRLLITNVGRRKIWRMEPSPAEDGTQTVTEVMGNGTLINVENAAALETGLNDPSGIAAAPDGAFYVADRGNNAVLRVGLTGKVTRVAGTSEAGFSGDGGPGKNAVLNAPSRLVLDGKGNLYIADTGNHRVRRLDVDGTISTVAGNGTGGYGGDGGPGNSALLNAPTALALDGQGRLYIADAGNNRVRRVDLDGSISTVAGSGKEGFAGDGAAATDAQLRHPNGVWVDGSGILFISDSDNHRIRQVGTDGVIQTVAGTGEPGRDQESDALHAKLNSPAGLTGDKDGNLLIAERGNHVIRRIDSIATPLTSIPAGPKASTATPPVGKKGDVNGDGRVNIQDVTAALQMAVGLQKPNAAALVAGDFNGDGKIDVAEAVHLLRASVGLDTL